MNKVDESDIISETDSDVEKTVKQNWKSIDPL